MGQMQRLVRVPLVSSTILVGLFGLWTLVAIAQTIPQDRQQPIQLSADSVSMDEKQRISVYRGKVDLRQGSLRLLADQVTVHHAPDNTPIKLVAVGAPAQFRQGLAKEMVQASAQRAVYRVRSAELTLVGEAKLTQASDTVTSDRIVYNRLRQVLKAGHAAAGKQRVQITLRAPE